MSIFSGILDKELEVSTFDGNFMVIKKQPQFISPDFVVMLVFSLLLFLTAVGIC